MCVVAASCLAVSGEAAELIVNGGFESGFSGWTRVDQVGSNGGFMLQSGTASPVNGLKVPAPLQGSGAAMTDQGAGGSHVLYQDFVVPMNATGGSLSFSLFINSGEDFRAPATLDWATPILNQQARVDILSAGSNPFSVASSDVFMTLFQTQPGSVSAPGYVSFAVDISPLLATHQGQTLRLRFAEVDNVSFFNLGVDAVSVAAIPEPASALLSAVGVLALLGGGALRKSRRPA